MRVLAISYWFSNTLAIPRSPTLIIFVLVRKTFWVLRSLCRMCFSCKYWKIKYFKQVKHQFVLFLRPESKKKKVQMQQNYTSLYKRWITVNNHTNLFMSTYVYRQRRYFFSLTCLYRSKTCKTEAEAQSLTHSPLCLHIAIDCRSNPAVLVRNFVWIKDFQKSVGILPE